MTPHSPSRYHFPARDRAEEIPGRIRRLAKSVTKMSKAEIARELYRCASAAQEHVLGMSARLTVQEGIAERHQYDIANAQREAVRGLVAETVGEVFNPNGYFVYLLWGVNPGAPLYVGQSANVFGRIGSHLGNPERRPYVKSVQLIRCPNEAKMMELESRLIHKYSPSWNIKGVDKSRTTGRRYS